MPFGIGKGRKKGKPKPGSEWPRRARRHDWQSYVEPRSPFAPFAGETLEWESEIWDDGTSYEGLAIRGIPHGRGVIIQGHMGAGGLKDSAPGDKYEGEVNEGFVHGLGQVTYESGEVYKGEFFFGNRNGCGQLTDYTPYNDLLASGSASEEEKREVLEEVEKSAILGTWIGDEFIESSAGRSKKRSLCSLPFIKGTVQEVDEVVTRARFFAHKPDGEAGIWFARDAADLPVKPLQEPLNYPYGTLFLAPGPAGQCAPLPDSDELKEAMLAHARNHARIHDAYNVDLNPEPGSPLWNALVLEAQRLRLAKRDKALEDEEAEERARIYADLDRAAEARRRGSSGGGGGGFRWPWSRRKAKGQPQAEAGDGAEGGAEGDAVPAPIVEEPPEEPAVPAAVPEAPPQAADDDDDEDYDLSDLTAGPASKPQGGARGGRGGRGFGSIQMSLGGRHPLEAPLGAAVRLVAALPLQQRRSLCRPVTRR